MSRWIFRGNLTLFHCSSARHACAVSWRNWATCTGTAKFPILDMIAQLMLSLFIRLLTQNADQNSTITERQDARRQPSWGKKKQSWNTLSHQIARSVETETKWKAYYPAALGPWLYNIWYFLPFPSLLFSASPKCDTIAVWRDCFLAPPLLSLTVITEVTWTYCTGGRKPSVGLYITAAARWPISEQ